MREALEVLERFGMFDVVLPFLLIFVLVFAILERTKVFGTEGNGETKKNLNAIFAFSLSLLAIISSKLINLIHSMVGPIMILLLLLVLFLMLVSVFAGPDETYLHFEKGKWFFSAFIGMVMLLIFFGSMKNDKGVSWLNYSWTWILKQGDSGAVGAVLLLVMIAGIVMFITSSGNKGGSE